MVIVTKQAETLEQGIKNLIEGAKQDYIEWSNVLTKQSDYLIRRTSDFDNMKVKYNKKYIKLISTENGYDSSVFVFIAKQDFDHFKKGDILKADGWKRPALNKARGNVLDGNYPINWTGAVYL